MVAGVVPLVPVLLMLLLNDETVRLSPRAFPQLPGEIVGDLERRGCRVPQSPEAGTSAPHNVIRGQFRTPGKIDWAVLCSRGGESSILVFWRGSPTSVAEIAKAKDADFLQGMGGSRIVYSRIIGTVGRQDIRQHYRWHGGPKPPPIDHEGIDDAFAGKASVVLYWHQGVWLELTGAD